MKINFVVTIFSLFGMLSSCDSKTKNKDFSEDKNLIIDWERYCAKGQLKELSKIEGLRPAEAGEFTKQAYLSGKT